MENSDNTVQENALCTKCMSFYGNKASMGMCSKCYKDELKLRGEDTSKQGIATTTETKPSGSMVPESKPAIEQKNQQEDTSKCFHCKKKTGIYGFKCKCGYTYCKMHRIPEDHECSYDFATAGQKLLEKNNPLIVGKKHDDI